MEVQPSIPNEQDQLGSWHPAMRPNVLENGEHDGPAGSAELLPPSTVSKELLESNAVSHQLPLRPKNPLQDRPSINDYPADSHQSAQATQNFSNANEDDIETLQANDNPFHQIGGRVANGKRSVDWIDDEGDSQPMSSGLVAPNHISEDPSGASRLNTTEDILPAVGLEHENEPLASPSSTHLGGVLGDHTEMNKVWELEEKDTSNRGIHMDRTNSFPVVPPVPQKTRPIPSQPLPHSQAEVIMEEETVVSPNLEFSNIVSPTKSLDDDPSRLKDDVLSSAVTEDQSFFENPQSVGGIAATLEVEESSRFEEGLPLMPTSQSEEIDSPFNKALDAKTDGLGTSDEEGDFFDKISPQPPAGTTAFEPPPLDRKSTNQVLDSMRYPPHMATHGESEAHVEGQTAGFSSEGFGSTKDNAPSTVFPEQEVDTPNSKSKDEDLAEMWKAALGDDDLLVDNEVSVDPSTFFEDDGEGFLDDDPLQLVTPSTIEPTSTSDKGMQKTDEAISKSTTTRNTYLPMTNSQSMQYTQHGHPMSIQNSSMSTLRASTEGTTQPFYPTQANSRPQMPASTQSFADKSKGGYTSPYDLPMDVSRPKKRSLYQQMHPVSDSQQPPSRPPPPRSSSMFAGAPPPADAVPPLPRLPSAYSPTKASNMVSPELKASPSVNSFFEELPTTKSRPSSNMGRFVPPSSQPVPTPPPPPPSREPLRQSSLPQVSLSNTAQPSHQYELLPPEKMSLYGNNAQTEATKHAIPASNARYSPAPLQAANVPPPRNRYAASPSASTRPPPSQTLPFQPRTSSPLAQSHSQPQSRQPFPPTDSFHQQPQINDKHSHNFQDSGTSSFPFPRHQSLDPSDVSRGNDNGITNSTEWRSSPPPLIASQHAPPSNSASDSSHAVNTPDPFSSNGSPLSQQNRELPAIAPGVPPRDIPRRSQTQSPGAGKYAPQSVSNQVPYQRPASVNHQATTQSAMIPANHARPRGRTLPKDITYIRPTDGREHDHLERWKGCPIFSFGFGGAIITSYPKQIPRYAAGQTAPLIKCSPGEVSLQDGKILPFDEDVAAFPGPLKSKGKKKEVVDWLQRCISKLESNIIAPTATSNLPDPSKRHEEKILLWKIMKIFVENEGVLDGNQSTVKAVRIVLSPELTQGDTAALPTEASNASILGITRRSDSSAIPVQAKPAAMEDLRKLLLHGEREKAVWHAVDNRLWAHAMLLSSTLDQNIWKQVSQEFVRQEVKTFGENTEALAALFQVFAGNWEESVDELVPPSARAGLQMVSKTANSGPMKNALDGLDRWRETLTLILSNRSSEDGKALISLGQLLAGYGRIEAAHICYIFVKSANLFGGPEDPQTAITLFGADHLQSPFDYGRDLDSILLTEVYEYARTVLSSSSIATVSPHLQPFKLYHAMILAEYGYKSEAQQYCEIITSTLNSTTKRSPYYHGLLLEALNGLMERLRQAPRDSSGSWISKPSIDKVSGSIWAKFNQYVAGDESDAASTGSGKGHDSAPGPFAGVHGDSPTLSRTPSSNDLYNSYAPGMSSTSTVSSSNSRYAPAGLYTPRSSFEQQGRPIQDSQRSHNDMLRPIAAQQQYQTRPNSSSSSYNESYKPVAPPSGYPTHTESYLPTPPLQPQYMPNIPQDSIPSSMDQHAPVEKPFQQESQALQEPHQSQLDPVSVNGYEPHSASYHTETPAYEPSSTSYYEPPASSSYSPPSYGEDIPPPEESQDETKPKKKSFMDDDDEDDFEARAAAIRKQDKARKDREADEAFRRAAEADAQKDKAPKLNSKKSGWLSGWLGGKKPEGEDVQSTPNAPIKAKLGEESSFYYDSEQKRWVNKKDPDATPAVKAAPPPPKGPPSRAVSASGPPPPSTSATPPVPPLPTTIATPPITFTKPPNSDPPPPSNPPSQYPSRSPSPALIPAAGFPAAEAKASDVPSGPPSAPPSRPATSMSGGSSIDDLIGAPQARKGGTIKKGKKKGYVDVMAK